jgi:hypothetical protein
MQETPLNGKTQTMFQCADLFRNGAWFDGFGALFDVVRDDLARDRFGLQWQLILERVENASQPLKCGGPKARLLMTREPLEESFRRDLASWTHAESAGALLLRFGVTKKS